MGSSAAWQLASYGEGVLLLEQQGRKYNHGSSHGKARITRSLGKRKDIFSFLQQTTISESQRLINFLNGVGDPGKHTMEQVYTTTPVNYLYSSNQLLKVKKVLHPKQKDKYEIGIGARASDLFGVTLPDYQFLIREYKKHSGTFDPKALIRMLHKGIKRRNGQSKFRRKVLSVTKVGDHYQVKVMHSRSGKTKRLKADKIVFASGPYNTRLLTDLAPYYDQLVRNKRLPLTFLKIKRRAYNRLSPAQRQQILLALPIFDQSTNKYFASIDQHGAMFFSMVEEFNKQGHPIFKVGGHQLRSQVYDLDAVWQERPSKKEQKWSRENFAKYLKLVNVPVRKKDLKVVRSSSCVYAISSTRKPIVSNIINENGQPNPSLVVMGGMSGVGAKGSLAYGLLAANRLLGIDDSRTMYQEARRQLDKSSIIAAHYIRKHGPERMSKFNRYLKKKKRLI
jgi:glycine/D-amino acid oxidase-like deaminating enzyme